MGKGIDVSEFQGKINWNKLQNNNPIDFSILKLGNIYDNQPNYLDSEFEYNYKNCIALNIPIGVYIYNYCNSLSNLITGIDWIIHKLINKKLQLPVFLDMEDHQSLICEGKEKLTLLCSTFCYIIKDKTNYIPGIYANLYWLDNYINANKLNHSKIWVAQYNSTCQYKGKYMLWQYTSSGKLDGINSEVDMNYWIDGNITSNNIITQWQNMMNLTYNCNLEIDGIFGPMCRAKALQHYLAYQNPIIQNDHVLFMQKLLNIAGYTLEEDSMFGPNCKEKTIAFQKDYCLLVDGCIGSEVTEKLLNLIVI